MATQKPTDPKVILARRIFLEGHRNDGVVITWADITYGGTVIIQYRSSNKAHNIRVYKPEELAKYEDGTK